MEAIFVSVCLTGRASEQEDQWGIRGRADSPLHLSTKAGMNLASSVVLAPHLELDFRFSDGSFFSRTQR
jgi:hypothetical protein